MFLQRNHSLFGAVKLAQAQKNALLSNGVRNALPPGVPRLNIPDSSSSEKTEGSDRIAPRYENRPTSTVLTVRCPNSETVYTVVSVFNLKILLALLR